MSDLEFKRMLCAAVLMSVVMSAVLSLYWTLVNLAEHEKNLDFIPFLAIWSASWLTSFLIACPASLFFAPIVKYCVHIVITKGAKPL